MPVRVGALLQFLNKVLKDQELRILAHDLGVEYEDLKGENRQEKIESFIVQCLIAGERLSLYIRLCDMVARMFPEGYTKLPSINVFTILSWWVEPTYIQRCTNLRVDNVKDLAFFCNGHCTTHQLMASDIDLSEIVIKSVAIAELLRKVLMYDDPNHRLEDFYLYRFLCKSIEQEMPYIWKNLR